MAGLEARRRDVRTVSEQARLRKENGTLACIEAVVTTPVTTRSARELGSLGRVRISDRGRVQITPRSTFDGSLSKTSMDGVVRQRKNGEYEVVVNFSCTWNTGGWVILVLGVLFLLIGIAVLLAPAMQKSELA